ncbi:uncharacterized protein CcaverHIS019_0402710 [Cutaneotrichosporon cavernicola]|uniref:Uncharacterized protein n=1 Tax=Cutaneotrichosporon cavernicola TaxID=279322 RepID=A0AA48L3U0_9TREE|nr:uncharacterized protein CcaverHIS019_0402710 [Cutaneotrichosporon cavernicola]BEI91451.1 hypothetical protein CcaverHIS019_0402710 [Cutaneotrichosporon cavernicola]
MYEHKNGPGMTWTTAHATPDGSEEELGRDLATDLDHAMNGGFYSERIIDGVDKVELGAIEYFDVAKAILTRGLEREYDLVVRATGFSNTIDSMCTMLGD